MQKQAHDNSTQIEKQKLQEMLQLAKETERLANEREMERLLLLSQVRFVHRFLACLFVSLLVYFRFS